jgi:hypothetical protein
VLLFFIGKFNAVDVNNKIFFNLMFKIKTYYFLLLSIFVSINSYSQKQGLNSIVQADLQHHMAFIASDSLEGRCFGTEVPGLQIAVEYIRDNIQKSGLKPVADSYFQSVPLLSVQPDPKKSFLKVRDKKGKVVYKIGDIISLGNGTTSEDILGEVVFAGFGWQDTISGYNDFENVDVKDKIVLYVLGNPDLFAKESQLRWNNRLETAKMEGAFKAGAKAVIVVTCPKDSKNQAFHHIEKWKNQPQYLLKTTGQIETKPFFITTPNTLEAMLGKHIKLRKELAHLAKGEKVHACLEENIEVEIQIRRETEDLGGKNIIGIVEGSDPVLKDEYMVYMAHYDHLGIGKNGDVYNGADDNGSGTVALLELAEAFQSLDVKPKRSILFLWVTGEEIGLFGSRYYVNHPVVPLEKTIACINIDMIGRVYEPRDSVWKKSPKLVKDYDGVYTLASNFCPQMLEISDTACKTLNLVPDKSLPERFVRSSDQYNFHKKGVPILNVATGYHADYHRVSDEISKINFAKMKRVTDFCFLVGFEIANQEKHLKIVSVGE